MTTVEDLRRRAKAGDLDALQALRDQGFFAERAAPQGYPVSHAQRRLWVVDQMVGGFGAYNLPIALQLTGALDPVALRSALLAIIRRHESLRTTFAVVDGTVRQFVSPEIDPPWAQWDLSGDPDLERRARHIAADHASQPFDLARGPLLRAGLVRLAPDRHLLLINIHHIVSDLVSLGVLLNELDIGYADGALGRPPSLSSLPIQYRDFAAWQNRLLAAAEVQRHRRYWLDQLAGPLPPLELPADFVRPPLKSYACSVRRIHLDAELTAQLRQLGLRHGMTLFMVLVATVKLLLFRYTGQQDIIVGCPLAGRDHPDLAGQIGCFVNTVALRDRLDADDSFVELLDRVRQTMLDAYEHQVYPFDLLVEELDLPRDMSRSPVFDVSISMANAEPLALRHADLGVSAYDDGFSAAKVDLSFDFFEAADSLELAISFCTDLFDDGRAQRMAAHFVHLAAQAAAHPGEAIGRMKLMSPQEARQILVDFNQTAKPLAPDETLVDLFQRQTERRPDGIALSFGERQLCFATLNREANRLARLLISYGVGPETMVGLCLEPSVEMVISFVGILKAGGVYVPLDPANPPHRLAAMLEDARPPVVLTRSLLFDRLPTAPDCWLLAWDDGLTDAMAEQADDDPPRATGPDHAAYMIFTSGSTGQAKAATLLHRGLANVAKEQAAQFGPAPGDRVLQFAAPGFDACIFEMTMALASGATLCLTEREQLLPGTALLATLEREQITLATLPPSALAALPEASLPKLRIIMVAGEACSAELVSRWSPGRAFFNLYGPTEATIWASAERCQPTGQAPTIGRPIGNTRLYVVDRQLQPVPVGIAGELCIAGAGLARHYLNRPELTRERFVDDPFDDAPDARLYRTGDLARWRADGSLEFLGRIDQQVKLRGYRIELSEIEATLALHAGVREAVALVRATEQGDPQLMAYATRRSKDSGPDANDLRRFLRERLPEYMVPARIVLLQEMPLTANKKIDRKVLSLSDDARPGLQTSFIAPRNDLEQSLAYWFTDVLRVQRVGIADNFFDLGGDSLMATRIVSRLHEAFRADVTIPQLFRAATVSALAELVRAALPEGRADKIGSALCRIHSMSDAEKQEVLSRQGR